MSKTLIVCLIASIALAGGVLLMQQDASVPVSAAIAEPKGARGDVLAASAVLKIDPRAQSASPSSVRPVAVALSPDMQAWLERKDWVGLYRRLAAAPATAEGQYLQAEILTACAKRVTQSGSKPASREQRRGDFLAALAPKDPMLEKRKSAYDQLNSERCGALAELDYQEAEVNRLVEAAAAAGDARARAWLLVKQIGHEYQAQNDKARLDNQPRGASGYPVSEGQFAAIRELLASQDPVVIGEFRNILASTIGGGAIRLGPDQESVDHQAMHHALALVACDFGAPCGPASAQMLSACALQARCDTGNLVDYTYFYGVSPHGAQLVERYRAQLGQMIATRDLSNLTLARVPGNSGNISIFGGSRR